MLNTNGCAQMNNKRKSQEHISNDLKKRRTTNIVVTDLPREIIYYISSFLPRCETLCFRLTCNLFNNAHFIVNDYCKAITYDQRSFESVDKMTESYLLWAQENGYMLSCKYMGVILRKGYIQCLKYTHKKGYLRNFCLINCFCNKTSFCDEPMIPHITESVIMDILCQRIEVVEYLHKIHYIKISDIVKFSIKEGHVKLLKWAYPKLPKNKEVNGIMDAITRGHLNIIKYLDSVKEMRKSDSNLIITALINNHKDIADWLLNNGYVINECFNHMASIGCVFGMHFLRECGYKWKTSSHGCPCYIATKHNNYECLKYSIENGCPIYTEALKILIKRGNIKFIKMMHKYGNNMTRKMSIKALRNGNMDVVDHVIKERTISVPVIIDWAIINHDQEIFKRTCTSNPKIIGFWAYESLINNSNIEGFEWLLDNDFLFDKHKCLNAIEKCSSNVKEEFTRSINFHSHVMQM